MPTQEMIYAKEVGDTFFSLWYAGEITPGECEEIKDLSDVPLEVFADFCDRNAESSNNHSYVGTHRILAALLHRQLGREQATRLLREIAAYGGLDSMSGCQGETSAFADFGIGDCWHEWLLPPHTLTNV